MDATQSSHFTKRRARLEAAHQNEIAKALALIGQSERLKLIAATPSHDRLLVDFLCRCLRTRPGDPTPFECEVTPVEILVPPAFVHSLSVLRVAGHRLPPGERAFSPHILPDETGVICTGSQWTPSTFSLDLLMLTAYDVLRGANVHASLQDTFNPEAVPHYQRLIAAGALPFDDASLI